MRSRKPAGESKSVKPLFSEPYLSGLRHRQAERPSIYVCEGCGAKRRHLIWGASGLKAAKAECPSCAEWVTFTVCTEVVEKVA